MSAYFQVVDELLASLSESLPEGITVQRIEPLNSYSKLVHVEGAPIEGYCYPVVKRTDDGLEWDWFAGEMGAGGA